MTPPVTDSPQVGTPKRPLRVAIVGAGPAGFYAALSLLEQTSRTVEVDLFERLPTPYGLVRAGVAPDHQKVKSITRLYERIGQDPRFAFFGNVELGRDIDVSDLTANYDQVLFAIGNEGDRRLGIPGEHLVGCTPASVFIGWYNGHPDFREARFDFSGRRVAVVGNGNVALDVARILAKETGSLSPTDIADHALLALRQSQIQEIVIIGRRGPLQATFTPAELRELLELPNVTIRIDPSALALDESTTTALRALPGKSATRRNYELLSNVEPKADGSATRTIEFRFCSSPTEFIGDAEGHLRAIRLEKNRLATNAEGSTEAEGTGIYEDLSVEWAFISVGFEGKRIPGVPFDVSRNTVANTGGRVVDPATAEVLANQYCTGWARTGPRGLISTQKTGAAEVVARMLEDLASGQVPEVERLGRVATSAILERRGVRWIGFSDWSVIDATEVERGQFRGAPRSKIVDIPQMIDLVEAQRRES